MSYPTAVQALADVQDTPESTLNVAPAGLGVCWIVQLDPFHASASVTSLPAELMENPTAVQAVAVVQDTPLKKLPCDPDGLGVGTTDQVVPSHASARVTSAG